MLLPTQWYKLRLNMNEYQERHRVSQLIGAPQGYVGYGEGAELTEALSAHPETVVVFDEIEKANPEVLQTLMNAMDAGQLSASARGNVDRRVDCRRSIFFFTSNLDAQPILEDLGSDGLGDPATIERVCRRRLRTAGVRPELIGRISTFLVFRKLTARARAEIATAAVVRVAEEYGLTLVRVEPTVVSTILDAYPEDLGARPDEYRLDELLGDTFAQAAAAGQTNALVLQGGPPFHRLPLSDIGSTGRVHR